MAPTNTPAALIEAAIHKSRRSHRSVALDSGIALSTFNRKINGHADFYLKEIAQIARALDVAPKTLLPREFHTDAAPSERRVLAGIAA
jgi:lambda repressor-like predicted transcriptional regulator